MIWRSAVTLGKRFMHASRDHSLTRRRVPYPMHSGSIVTRMQCILPTAPQRSAARARRCVWSALGTCPSAAGQIVMPTSARRVPSSRAGLLHWFTSPYVHRLAYDAASGVVETRTLNVLARPRVDRFPASAVRYPQTLQPQATFQVNQILNRVHAGKHQFVCTITMCIRSQKQEIKAGLSTMALRSRRDHLFRQHQHHKLASGS